MKEKKKKRKFSILDEEYSLEEIKGAKKEPPPSPIVEAKEEDPKTKRVRLRMKIVDLPLKSKVELLKAESSSDEEYLSLVKALIGDPDEIFGKLALTKEVKEKNLHLDQSPTASTNSISVPPLKAEKPLKNALEPQENALASTHIETSVDQKESNVGQSGALTFSAEKTSGIAPVVSTSGSAPVVPTSGTKPMVENTTGEPPVVKTSGIKPVVDSTTRVPQPVVADTTRVQTPVVNPTTGSLPVVPTSGNLPVVNSTTGPIPVVSTSGTQPVVAGRPSMAEGRPQIETSSEPLSEVLKTRPSAQSGIVQGALNQYETNAQDDQVDSDLLGYLLEAVPSKKAEVVEERGWTKYPNELIQFASKRIKGKGALAAWNCLMKYSCGFHRDYCYLSLGHFAEWSGIGDRSNASKAIRSLIDEGLVKIVKEPNLKRQEATVYQVIPVTAYFKRTRELHPNFEFWEEYALKNISQSITDTSGIKPVVGSTTGGTPQVVSSTTGEVPVVQNHEWLNSPLRSGNPDHSGVVNPTTYKESPKNPLNNSHPLGSALFEGHLESLKAAPLQRAAELKNLNLLLGAGNEIQVLEEAFKRLKKDGIRGEPCQLPFTYLCKSGSQLLSEAKDRIEKRERAKSHASNSTNPEEQIQKSIEATEELYRQMEAVFMASLSAEERSALIEGSLSAQGLKDDGGVLAEIAKKRLIQKWWAENYES